MPRVDSDRAVVDQSAMRYLVLLLVVLAGCDEAKKAAKQVDQGLDDSQVTEMKERVTRVKAALAAGTEARSDCAAGLAIGDDVGDSPEAKAAITELRTLCNRDLPLAAATRTVEATEKARAADPKAQPLSECFDEAWTTATNRLDASHKNDPAWVALEDRWAKACPPM